MSWVRCGSWLYRFLIFAILLSLCIFSVFVARKSLAQVRQGFAGGVHLSLWWPRPLVILERWCCCYLLVVSAVLGMGSRCDKVLCYGSCCPFQFGNHLAELRELVAKLLLYCG